MIEIFHRVNTDLKDKTCAIVRTILCRRLGTGLSSAASR